MLMHNTLLDSPALGYKLGRSLAALALLGTSLLGAGPASVAAAQDAGCDPDLTAFSQTVFGGFQAALGARAGTPADCAYVDATGNLVAPTTTGVFMYAPDLGTAAFSTGSEDWVWQDGSATLYSSSDAPAPAPAAAASGGHGPGGTYVGTVQTRQKLTIEVSPDGSQITSISAVVYCTDMSRTTHTETITYAPTGPFAITGGKASFSELKETLDRVTYTYYLDATFDGDQVSGTLKIKSFVQGPAAACNTSDLKFTATRQ